jgi:MFS family permease
VDRIGRKRLQVGGFVVMAIAFALLWLIPGATTTLGIFIVLFGATYFFAEFGPNTTTFVYSPEIFPVHVRTTSHGIAAAASKIGAFLGAASMLSLLTWIGLGRTSLLVAAIALAGALVTVFTLPEPCGKSLEEIGPDDMPASAVTLGVAESRAPGHLPRHRGCGIGRSASAGRWCVPRCSAIWSSKEPVATAGSRIRMEAEWR